MDLRHSRIRKDGKTHTYWRRVRSVRRQGKVVQESVRPREQRVATHQRHVHRLHAIAGTHTARPHTGRSREVLRGLVAHDGGSARHA